MSLVDGTTVKPKDQIDLGTTVTQGDVNPNASGFSAFFGLDSWYRLPTNNKLLPDLPLYWSKRRDQILATTIDHEDFWASAVAIAITKAGSQSWEIESKEGVGLQVRRAQELFHAANGGEGWGHFISQHLTDFFLTDNGAFIEIDRVDNAKPGSKIVGLYHLDSMRCYRTGNPDTPVLYVDLHGEYHMLAWWQVVSLADQPNTRSNYFGVGRCAASRAYRRIQRMVATERYLYEKVSGGEPKELNFISGITEQQLRNIIESNEAERRRQGLIVYGGAALVALMAKDNISHVQVPIASLPDRFDPEIELDQALLAYANALGIDVQELRELKTNGSLGSGAQSRVLDDKQDGKGLAFWRKRFGHLLNNHVLPSTVTFYFVENDLRDKKLRAEVFTAWAGGVVSLAKDAEGNGVLTSQQMLQKLVDENQLPKEFLPTDLTPGLSLEDGEKPALEGDTVATPSVEDLVAQVNEL